ncbi:MAG TPA: glycerol-3-phosphate dehydrogenase/oxidase [Steroidobacteraceae bacterium]|jgi:glycerol-3-phosphate dehydrogenase|nr:glycerol-3-phosphate dehydrogenase/oxidase [Steroidobacteraceae bacterium]
MPLEPSLGDTPRTSSLNRLANETFDVLVIGGGIGAACTAWDAALRGLRVALVERLDFGSGASAHSFKVLHGGIRYLQHLDIVRLRESCRERGAFLRIAPHLTRPLPFAVPTFGYAMQSRWVFGAALATLETLTCDRNRATRDPLRRVPKSYLLTRDELLRRFENVDGDGLTGAGVFFDGQILNPPRAVLAVIRSAASHGAAVANYCEAQEMVVRDGRVVAMRARDLIRGEVFDIRARVIINATGPFAPSFVRRLGAGVQLNVPLSRDMAFVVRRVLDPEMAVGVQTRYRDPDAMLSRGNRHLFMAPWRGRYTLIGVNSRVYTEDAYDLHVTEGEIEGFLQEINEASPPLAVRRDEVTVVNAGLLPFGENSPDQKDLSFGKRSQIIDHASTGGPEGLVSAMSIRWTMGRLLGERVVDLAQQKLGIKAVPCSTTTTRVWGGDIESVEGYAREMRRLLPAAVSDAQATRMFQHYGTKWSEVLAGDDREVIQGDMIPATDYFGAEVRYAVRNEMASTLSDVVMRRLGLGSAERPADETLAACASIAGDELGWSLARREREIQSVRDSFPFASPRSQYPRFDS